MNNSYPLFCVSLLQPTTASGRTFKLFKLALEGFKCRICRYYECQLGHFNPLTAGVAYIRFFIFISTLSTTL